jgi:hypothetical protein
MNILLLVLIVAMLPIWALGLYLFIKVLILPNVPPADVTNRINHIRIVFYAIQHPEKFISICPWVGKDEAENVNY